MKRTAVPIRSADIDDATADTTFVRTPRRQQRIRDVLSRRQADLTVVLEDVHDPHNAAAVLRSCDAVGVLDVHMIYVHEPRPRRSIGKLTSASAAKWLRTHTYDSVEACYAALRAEGKTILTTALTEDGQDLYAYDLTQPTALVFGNEMRGASDAAIEQADGVIIIPMMGMVESLNISVACAVTLFEAMRQRRDAGAYDEPRLDAEERAAIEAEWLRR